MFLAISSYEVSIIECVVKLIDLSYFSLYAFVKHLSEDVFSKYVGAYT